MSDEHAEDHEDHIRHAMGEVVIDYDKLGAAVDRHMPTTFQFNRPLVPREEPTMKKLMTADEVADLLSVPLTRLYAWSYRGVGPPAYKIGKNLRYDSDKLQAWLDEQEVKGG